MSDIMQPLRGVKVVDLTLAGSGPSCTKVLSEAGASVIWVESTRGTTTRSVHKYDFYCAGKQAVSINLKSEGGRKFIERAIKDADVFVSNYRPKGLAHLNLSYEDVKAIKPDIIYATLTGFGEKGPNSNDAGYDTVAFWGRSGMMQDIAEKGSLVVPPIAVGDISTGMTLFGGICAALYQRAMTGKGCHVYTSLLSQGIYLNHDAIIELQYGAEYPKSRRSPRRALLNTYRCRDGKWIAISLPGEFDRYFSPLMKVLGLSHLDDGERWKCYEDTMHEKAPELVEILDEAFAKLDQEEALALLRSADVPCSKIQTSADTLTDPQVLANGYLHAQKATTPPPGSKDGMILVPTAPIRFESDDYGVQNEDCGPTLGQDTESVLLRYGFTKEEIEAMRESGQIRG